jgi:DNA-binding NarL/FixJ family response regulator
MALADDHPVVLAGIKSLLMASGEVELVGEACDGASALALAKSEMPDIIVIDISMPGMNGLDLARNLQKECPSVKIIALTVHEDRAYVQPLIESGVRGYVLKRSAAEDLLRAVRAVQGGGIYLDPAITEKALPESPQRVEVADVQLSRREEAVLRLTAQGFSNKEIAARLEVSVKSVETYKARASEKLQLRSRAQIVRFGASRGWLSELN